MNSWASFLGPTSRKLKKMSQLDFRNLPEERLSTTDEHGDHVNIIPAEVSGYWKNKRRIMHIFLIFVLFALPWIEINGEQALLFNIPDRVFNFFGLIFFAHDAPKVFFILGGGALVLALVTALWGRVWCGWACPQTVFIETIFRGIETLLLGNRQKQVKFYKQEMNFKKLLLLSTKWGLFLFLSLIISHTLVAYFVGRENLFHMMSAPPAESWTVFVIMAFITGVILFDFGWFREQFCIIMCPYGRFQSVLMDESSKTVTYDYNRGEPRGKKSDPNAGDCVDCFKCVSVCPTGIDIRRGQQLECIACTRCIDACDEIMTKLNRPKGLIRYASINDLKKIPSKLLSPRIIGYGVLLLAIIVGATIAIGGRTDLAIHVTRTKNSPFQIVEEKGQKFVLNQFSVNIKNQSHKPHKLIARIQNSPAHAELIFPLQNLTVDTKKSQRAPFFIRTKAEAFNEMKDIRVKVEIIDYDSKVIYKTRELKIAGPYPQS